MKNDNLIEIVDKRIAKCSELLKSKGEHYSRKDRYSNFFKGAGILGVSPEEACIGYAVKHIESIVTMSQDATKDIFHTEDEWDEKLNDMHNYLFLLEGLINLRLGGELNG